LQLKLIDHDKLYVKGQRLPYYFTEEITFQGDDYTKDGDKRDLKLLLYRPKTTKHSAENPSPALMYIHGGAAIALPATCADYPCQRWADENDLVVFSVEYRLAPETPAPGGILDCYAGLRYILANAEKYGVDPKRVTFSGDSGGGYLSVALGMELSRRGEASLVPFMIGSACMIGSALFNMTEEDYAKGYDDPHGVVWFMTASIQALAGVDGQTPYAAFKDRADVFVTNMGDDLLKNFPPTVLFTSEFDSCRWGTEDMARLLEKHGKLLDYIVHPGTEHCWYLTDTVDEISTSLDCWADYRKIFSKYLRRDENS
jgi:acetyl esterase